MERHLYVYEYAAVPYEHIIELLAAHPTAILQPSLESEEESEEVRSTLHVPLGGFELTRDIKVTVGELEHLEDGRASLPVAWKAASKEGLFPGMTATLEISALADQPPRSQVSLIGVYTPPAGALGAFGDSVGALHRRAESAVHRLLRDICQELERSLPDAADDASA